MEVMLDCALLNGRESVHDYLKDRFGFPDYYGKNLDALYDCLCELPPCRVILLNADRAQDDYACAVLDTIRDAAQDNPDLELV